MCQCWRCKFTAQDCWIFWELIPIRTDWICFEYACYLHTNCWILANLYNDLNTSQHSQTSMHYAQLRKSNSSSVETLKIVALIDSRERARSDCTGKCARRWGGKRYEWTQNKDASQMHDYWKDELKGIPKVNRFWAWKSIHRWEVTHMRISGSHWGLLVFTDPPYSFQRYRSTLAALEAQ